jgi:hypothetical protein
VVRAAGATRAVTGCWADLTGQPQSWSLFAPNVTDYLPFVEVELRWGGGRPAVLLLSENEPADRDRFFRLGRFRLRRYESSVDVSPLPGRPFDPAGEDWRDQVAAAVANRWPHLLAYLRWRLEGFARDRPDLPRPGEVILCVHLFRIPGPPGPRPWDWEDLGRHPVARWRPAAGEAPAALDAYDPCAGRFAGPRGEPP